MRLLRNDTFDILSQVQAQFLGPIRGDLQDEIHLMGGVLGSDINFEPVDIKDLKDIKQSSISAFLRAGNEIEKIIHHSYGRLMIQIAYLNLYKDMLRSHPHFKDKINGKTKVVKILEQSERLSCRLYDFTKMLGIGKIKKKLCKLIDIKSFKENRDEKEYIQSILQLVGKSFNTTIDAIENLNSQEVTENCHYDCTKTGKVVLKCNAGGKQLRNAPTGRKHRKNRKNKSKVKRKNKGRKNCKKNKGTKRRCRNRRRNKQRSQKRKNNCFKCK